MEDAFHSTCQHFISSAIGAADQLRQHTARTTPSPGERHIPSWLAVPALKSEPLRIVYGRCCESHTSARRLRGVEPWAGCGPARRRRQQPPRSPWRSECTSLQVNWQSVLVIPSAHASLFFALFHPPSSVNTPRCGFWVLVSHSPMVCHTPPQLRSHPPQPPSVKLHTACPYRLIRDTRDW